MSLKKKPLSAVDEVWILVLYFLFPMVFHDSTGTVSFVTVLTHALSNPNPRIWYRVPSDYRAVTEAAHRFPDVPTTAVSPPEFCNLPSNARILK